MSDLLAEKVHGLFKNKTLTLSLAESCTGGAVSARLARIAGASAFLQGAIVAYSNSVKQRILSIPETILAHEGAVSQATAQLMAENALKLFSTDVAVSVTGIAGPSGESAHKPVGTIWCAIAQSNQNTLTWQLALNGSRDSIIDQTSDALLEKLCNILNQ